MYLIKLVNENWTTIRWGSREFGSACLGPQIIIFYIQNPLLKKQTHSRGTSKCLSTYTVIIIAYIGITVIYCIYLTIFLDARLSIALMAHNNSTSQFAIGFFRLLSTKSVPYLHLEFEIVTAMSLLHAQFLHLVWQKHCCGIPQFHMLPI